MSDHRLGHSKRELLAQRTYSAAVVAAIRHNQPWRWAPRHRTCWAHVPWARLCNQVRLRLQAQRWLYQRASVLWARLYVPRRPTLDQSLVAAFTCIHRYEGAWTDNTGNGYYGGLQMDYRFQSTYGGDYLRRWGTADNWPAWAQLDTAIRAYRSGRGFGPWPNTARACGLL